MDFVTGLPECEEYDAIWVVVDRLSKMRQFIPCRTTVDARGLAEMFIKEVVQLYGLHRTIVSDRSPQFAAVFSKRLGDQLWIKRKLSMAFHLETDVQTGKANASME
jgi:hypothetical protein